MDARALLLDVARVVGLTFNPSPMYIYKPRPDGSGVAVKLNLRLKPVFNEDEGYVDTKATEGGLFLELVGQTGRVGKGENATFAWMDDTKKVTAKIGLADQLGLLTAIRQVRHAGKPVPSHLRPKNEADEAKAKRTVSLFHKFGTSSTAITYVFEAEQSYLGVSKSAAQRKSATLTLMDELQLETYLEHSLRAYVTLGIR